MRHARPEDLAPISDLLGELRALPGLTEKSPGAFYRKGKAFLHFHEHGGELFADIHDTADWERVAVTPSASRNALMRRARKACAPKRSAS
jgi:hypothetical protein